MKTWTSYWDESIEAISDDFVLGDEDNFLNVDAAMHRLVDVLDINPTCATIMIEGWIVDALCAQPLYECDCCTKLRPRSQMSSVVAFGIDTFACNACRGG